MQSANKSSMKIHIFFALTTNALKPTVSLSNQDKEIPTNLKNQFSWLELYITTLRNAKPRTRT